MKTNAENDRLLLRALEKSAGGDTSAGFTGCVMGRVAKEQTHRERRENRLLLAGAIMCTAGLVVLVVCLLHALPETGIPESLGVSLSRFGASSGQLKIDWGESGDITRWSCGCAAVVFLALAMVRLLLFRKHPASK